MRKANDTLVFRWFKEVWNDSRKEVIDELLKDDVTAHGLGPEGKTHGLDAFKQFYDDFRSQFKDVHVIVEDVISEDDIETARCSVKAIHIPSGKEVNFTGMSMAKIEDGKIAESWNSFDFLTMYQQAGFALAPQL